MKVIVKFPDHLLLAGDGIEQLSAILSAMKGAIPVARTGYGKESKFEAATAGIEVTLALDSAINLPTAVALMGATNGKD